MAVDDSRDADIALIRTSEFNCRLASGGEADSSQAKADYDAGRYESYELVTAEAGIPVDQVKTQMATWGVSDSSDPNGEIQTIFGP